MKKHVLIISSIIIFLSNIIIPYLIQYIDIIFYCKLELINYSINNDYGIFIYYVTISPILIFMIYKFKKNSPYILTLLILKLFFMITSTGIDDSQYHFFKEMTPICHSKIKVN